MRDSLQAHAGSVLPRGWQHAGWRFVSQCLLGYRGERADVAAELLHQCDVVRRRGKLPTVSILVLILVVLVLLALAIYAAQNLPILDGWIRQLIIVVLVVIAIVVIAQRAGLVR